MIFFIKPSPAALYYAAWRNCSIAGKETGWDDLLVAEYAEMADYLEKHVKENSLTGFIPSDIPEPAKEAIADFWDKTMKVRG